MRFSSGGFWRKLFTTRVSSIIVMAKLFIFDYMCGHIRTFCTIDSDLCVLLSMLLVNILRRVGGRGVVLRHGGASQPLAV